ncbi:hypothetical protein DFH29DRAFT_816087 [Suillus ampliporus]|nr:hypothetical protein DFH29DRAFT_816087 [Suillus ampliporus]
MPQRRRNTQTQKQRGKTDVARRGQKTDDAVRAPTANQFQHFISRFILRKFQVEPPMSRGERQKEFRLTGVYPGHVHYYDVATRSLDIRPIGKVYGVPGIYQDVHNTENINELEEKLGALESLAAPIIEDLHDAIHQGTFTLKRGSLELLQKFLFIMYYRHESRSSQSFRVDRPENAKARHWIEHFMKANGIQSAVEMWLHVLRYYLDGSHSDILQDATELVEKYGEEGLEEMHFPAITYQNYVDDYFLSIWEAAKGEEFILTHNSFGLREGVADGCPNLHRIFVISPRIAIVLCNALLRPENKGRKKRSSLKSCLLDANPAPATQIYTNGRGGIRCEHGNFKSPVRYTSSKEGGNDSFLFKITKLTRRQTLDLNSVVLANVKDTGSLTFLTGKKMLRTARAFRSLHFNLPASDLVVPLIAHLTAGMGTGVSALRSPLQSPAVVPDEQSPVDVLLMQICTGRLFETAREAQCSARCQNVKGAFTLPHVDYEGDPAGSAPGIRAVVGR